MQVRRVVKRGLQPLLVQGLEQQLSQRTSVIRRQVDKGDLDGSTAYRIRYNSPPSGGILAGGDRQALLDQHLANDPWLHPWDNPCGVGHRKILSNP